MASQGFASYTLRILLPQDRPALAMEVGDVYCAYRLFANGRIIAQNGEVGESADRAKPFWSTQTLALSETLPDTLDLVLQVCNFWHAKGGPYKEILLGDQKRLFMKRSRESAYDLILAGCLFMGGLFFLGLYLFGRNDKATLYFALFCMLYSYRMVGTDAYVLHSLFTDFSWFVSIRLEYVSLSLSVALFALYSKHLYPEDAHALAMKMMVWLCGLYTVVIFFTPPWIFTRYIDVFLICMFLCIAYACFVYFRAALNRRSGSYFALISSVMMILIFLLINLNYFGVAAFGKEMIFGGYIAFFFLQSLALSHRFAGTHKRATLQAQQGLKAKSEFLSTMSHEIRTPLNAVIGMTHLLLNNNPREDQHKDLDVLLFSANNLLSIVNNILDFTKIEEGKIQVEQIVMDLDAIARHIIAGFRSAAAEKKIDLQLALDPGLNRKILGDPTRSSQVINNLVHNAIKFTSQGWVRLSLHAEEWTSHSVRVRISVEDTGIGIPKEKQQVIFERFTQADSSTSRSYGGTGLGLAISKKILELQGVELQLRSEPNRGSVFYFMQTFPICQEQAMQPEGNPCLAGDDDKQLRGVSILLVEDNPLNVLVAQTILENRGASVEVASNGQEALDAFDANRHQLILMDLQMPVMDGYRAAKMLRSRGETVPIIALTANMPQEVASDMYACGITDIVVKPFSPENLYRVILNYVDPNIRRAVNQ